MLTRRWFLRGPNLVMLAVTVLVCLSVSAAEKEAPAPERHRQSEMRMRQDITFLASDECEGRGPGTKGIDKAADHIAAEFKKAGLKPGGTDGSYFQPFTLNANVLDAAHLWLKGPGGQKIKLKKGEQFWPMGLGAKGWDMAAVVFAGYGITSDKAHYDDYADLDVAGKIVILVRGAPQVADKDAARELTAGASFDSKVANAEKHQAAAVLIVNNAPAARNGDDLLDFNYTAFGRSRAKIPVFHVRRSVLEMMLPGGADALTALEKDIGRNLKPSSRELTGWTAHVDVKMHHGLIVKNVVGVLEGAGPLANETVVVGAHYDHLGYGAYASLASRKYAVMAIHHGADDNGSGTTSMLELARRFAALPERQGRRLVFIAFSGEELGLLGSAHYCKHPLYPLKETASMYNLDMVGRLRPDKDTGKPKLLTEGSGTAKPFRELLDKLAQKYDFKMVHKPSGFGPSDHASFCSKDIPVLFVWTDYHDDYHRPSDTADRINIEGMRRIADMSQEAITTLTQMDKPAFIKVKSSSPNLSNSPRLGIRPGDGEGKGVLIEEVVEDQPAAKAGLKKGDLIVSLTGKPVKGIQDVVTTMKNQKAGSTIEVGILRDGKPRTIKVKLEGANAASMPRLGIRPSYSDEGEGVLIDGVTDDKPAARAGLKKGDRIVQFAGKPVKNVEDYTQILKGQKKGDTIDIVIIRDGKKMTVKVKPE